MRGLGRDPEPSHEIAPTNNALRGRNSQRVALAHRQRVRLAIDKHGSEIVRLSELEMLRPAQGPLHLPHVARPRIPLERRERLGGQPPTPPPMTRSLAPHQLEHQSHDVVAPLPEGTGPADDPPRVRRRTIRRS
jgi:hypothetical protein